MSTRDEKDEQLKAKAAQLAERAQARRAARQAAPVPSQAAATMVVLPTPEAAAAASAEIAPARLTPAEWAAPDLTTSPQVGRMLQEHQRTQTDASARNQATAAAGQHPLLLVVNGKMDRGSQGGKPVTFTPSAATWARFKAAFNGSSEGVALSYILAAGLDALEARAQQTGGVIMIRAEDLK